MSNQVGSASAGEHLEAVVQEGTRRLLLLALPLLAGLAKQRASKIACLALVGGWPLLLNAVLALLASSFAVRTAKAWGWLVAFALVDIGALAAALYVWQRLSAGFNGIVTLLPSDARKRALADWFYAWFSNWWQIASGVTAGVLGVVVLHASVPIVRSQLEISAISYMSVAWTCFLGGLALYALVLVTRLAFKLETLGPLDLDPWEPASTPGVRSMSEGYVLALGATVILSGIVEFMAIKVPSHQQSEVLAAFLVGFPIAAVVCGLAIGVLPQYAIYRIIAAGKEAGAARINMEIGTVDKAVSDNLGRSANLLALRAHISSSPNLPVQAPWLVPLVAALIGPLIAYLLTRQP
jgi:hypothetical protein